MGCSSSKSDPSSSRYGEGPPPPPDSLVTPSRNFDSDDESDLKDNKIMGTSNTAGKESESPAAPTNALGFTPKGGRSSKKSSLVITPGMNEKMGACGTSSSQSQEEQQSIQAIKNKKMASSKYVDEEDVFTMDDEGVSDSHSSGGGVGNGTAAVKRKLGY